MDTSVYYVALFLFLVIIAKYIFTTDDDEGTTPSDSFTTDQTPQERFASVTYSAKEVATHASRSDAWVIVDGGVYDISAYVDIHPGGDSILEHVGGDASAGFHGDQHPQPKATDVLNEMFIGHLRDGKKDK